MYWWYLLKVDTNTPYNSEIQLFRSGASGGGMYISLSIYLSMWLFL
jgi:hypothetical protein